MKKLILGAWIAVLGFSATAQEKERVQKTPEEMASFRVEKLKESLGLDAKQQSTIQAAMVSKMTQVRQVKEKHAGNRETMKTEMQPIYEQFNTTMKATLSQEQYIKWLEMRNEKVAKGKHHKKGHHKHGAKGEKCQEHKMHHDRKQKLEEK